MVCIQPVAYGPSAPARFPNTDSGRYFRALLLAPRGASAKYIDEIIALIAGGMTGAEACASRPEYPNYRSLTEWAAKNGRMVDISAAWRGREKSDNARMKTNVIYTEEQWDAALELLAANPRKSIRRLADQLGVDLPPRGLIYQRKRRDPDFAARFAEAVKATQSVISRHTPTAPRPVYRSGLLRAALLRNEYYVAAVQALKGRIYRDDIREDALSYITLALLEGDITIEQLREDPNRVIKNFLSSERFVFESLDAPVFHKDERMSRVDMMSTNELFSY